MSDNEIDSYIENGVYGVDLTLTMVEMRHVRNKVCN